MSRKIKIIIVVVLFILLNRHVEVRNQTFNFLYDLGFSFLILGVSYLSLSYVSKNRKKYWLIPLGTIALILGFLSIIATIFFNGALYEDGAYYQNVANNKEKIIIQNLDWGIGSTSREIRCWEILPSIRFYHEFINIRLNGKWEHYGYDGKLDSVLVFNNYKYHTVINPFTGKEYYKPFKNPELSKEFLDTFKIRTTLDSALMEEIDSLVDRQIRY